MGRTGFGSFRFLVTTQNVYHFGANASAFQCQSMKGSFSCLPLLYLLQLFFEIQGLVAVHLHCGLYLNMLAHYFGFVSLVPLTLHYFYQ